MKIPRHVAIIPDGNRRWALSRKLPQYLGHFYGAKTSEKILDTAYKLHIPYITFWIASLDNLTKRPKEEVNYLFDLFEKKFNELKDRDVIHREKVRVRIIGFWQDVVPPSLKKIFYDIEEMTKDYSNYTLTFLMAYNGDLEMLEAIKNSILQNEPINPHFKEESLRKHLLTGELPDVDLVIRTGGSPHLSAGFMMWHLRYSQLYFTDTFWPSFQKKEFMQAIKEYSDKERRMGR